MEFIYIVVEVCKTAHNEDADRGCIVERPLVANRLIERVLWFGDNSRQQASNLVVDELVWFEWREHNLNKLVWQYERTSRLVWEIVTINVTAEDTRKACVTKSGVSNSPRCVVHNLAIRLIHDAETHLEVDTLRCVVHTLWALYIVRQILYDGHWLDSTEADITSKKFVVVGLCRWNNNGECKVCILVQRTDTIRHVDNAKNVLVLLELDRKEVLRYRVVVVPCAHCTDTTVSSCLHVVQVLC